MKNVFCGIFAFILIGCGSSQMAWAESELPEWMKEFEKNYDTYGMSTAVEDALADDVSPNNILTFIISRTEKFRRKKGLKALYCAGVDRNAVREAANKLGIEVDEVSMSLEEAIAECGSKLTLDDRDLMDTPASSPESGTSASVITEEFIIDPSDSGNPSSPARP